MALTKQPYAIQFQGGIDSKTDSKQVGYTKLLDLQNAVFTKNTTLVKRNGYKALGRSVDGSTSGYLKPQGLGTRGDELLLFADGLCLSHRTSSDTWSNTGAVQSVVANSDTIARTGTHQNVPDAATNNGVTVCAWEDSRGGVWTSVLEATGGRILLPATQLDASGLMPRCIAVGQVLMVLWVKSNVIWCAIVNPAAPGNVPTPEPLVTDLDPSRQFYDAISTFDAFDSVVVQAAANYDSTGRPGLIAWAAATGLRVGYIHQSAVLGSPSTLLPSVGTVNVTVGGPIAIDIWGQQVADGSAGDPTIGVVYVDTSGNLKYVSPGGFVLGDSTSFTLVATQAWNRVTCAFGGIASNGTPIWWAGERTGGTDDTTYVMTGKFVNNTVTASTTVRGHALATRAFYDNGEVYVGLVHPVQFFPYVAICQLSSSMRAQARLLPGLSAGILSRAILPSVYPLNLGTTGSDSRQHATCLGYRIQLSGTSGTQFGEVGVQLFSLDFDNADAYRSVQLGRGTYLGGALIQHYDGDRWAEADFHCAPDTASGTIATSQTTGGSLTTTSTYGYKLLYEEIDGQGELHPGAVSVQINVTLTGSNDAVMLTIPTYRLTSKKRVRIGVFRSLANATGSPSQIPFYRVSSVDPTAVGANGYVLNDSTVDTVSFTDKLSDATAETLEPLYTNGGILGNDPAPSAGAAIAGGKQRLFWTDPTDPHLVYFSQQLRDDTAVEFSAALSMRTDPYGGSVVGLGVMDDGVFAFKDTAIYVADGPGPDADGGLTTNNAFTPWELVTSDVGCKSAGSICQTPNGLVFQSQKGIKLLGRDRQVVDIGSDVYAYNDQTITRATLLPDRHQVVFLTDSGSTLLWDYLRGQWSRFTNHEGIDAVVVSNTYHYLRNDGRVFQETPGKYADDNMHIPMVIETAWIKMAGYLQGWQRVLYLAVIGAYKSSHQLQIRYRINYQDAYNSLSPINVDSSYTPQLYGAGQYGAGTYGGAVGSDTVYQEQVHLNRACQSISFQFSDIEGTAQFGPAFELSELLLIGGVLGGKYPMGSARSQ